MIESRPQTKSQMLNRKVQTEDGKIGFVARFAGNGLAAIILLDHSEIFVPIESLTFIENVSP